MSLQKNNCKGDGLGGVRYASRKAEKGIVRRSHASCAHATSKVIEQVVVEISSSPPFILRDYQIMTAISSTPNGLDTTSSAVYTNHPLGKATAEIRLLSFSPSEHDTVSCRFQVFSLEECPPYTALSYMWGDENPITDSNVLIDGLPFSIRENLGQALRRIQANIDAGNFGASFLLWVDALCINQEDLQERSHQVSMMGRIYSGAELVLVWLGEENYYSRMAMRFLKETPSKILTGDRRSFVEELFSKENGIYDAMLRLYYRPYWKRLWIQQEIILATEIIVLCGGDSCTWEALKRLNSAIEGAHDHEVLKYAPASETVARVGVWARQDDTEKTLDNLMHLWTYLWQNDCADPRDRVFGLLGLVGNDQRARLGIEANYEKTRTEIFCDIWTYIVKLPEWKTKFFRVLGTLLASLELKGEDIFYFKNGAFR